MKTKIAAVTTAALIGAAAIGVPTGNIATIPNSSITASAATTTAKVNISKCTVKISNTRFAYTGKAIKPTVTVKNGSVTLKNGTDYTVTYSNNVNPNGVNGSSVTIKGKGKYTGSIKKTFTLCVPITDTSWVKFDDSGRAIDDDGNTRLIGYNGGEQLTYGAYVECLKGKFKGRHICVANGDYEIQYYKYSGGKWVAIKNPPTTLGKYKVVYTGKGNFCGIIARRFDVVEAIIGSNNIAWTGAVPTYTYDGTAKAPNASSIKVTVHNKVLTLNKDYTVSYVNNVNAGYAGIVVKGKGNYRSGGAKTFVISAKNISDLTAKTVLTSASKESGVNLSNVLFWDSKALKVGTDYIVEYEIEDNTVTAVFTGKGNYTGTKVTKVETTTK